MSDFAHLPSSILVLSAAEMRSAISLRLAKQLNRSVDSIDTAKSLNSFGLSSLEGMILLGELEDLTGQDIGSEAFSEDTTIDELVAQIVFRFRNSP